MESLKFYFKRLVFFPFVIVTLHFLIIARRFIEFVYALIFKNTQPEIIRTPEDCFQGLDALGYDFKPNYVRLPIGGGKTLPRLHYVDEGSKDARETILCLHGEPSWSFLYRKMIPAFVNQGYRVIAPDFIGFGKSDKYTYVGSYTHELHTMTLRLLIDYLQLNSITLVCQDWGGLTGLSVSKDCPSRFSHLVIMNVLPCGIEIKLNKVAQVTPFLFWQACAGFLGTYLPIDKVFSYALINKTDDIIKAYCAPFPSNLYKAGCAKWPLLVPLTSNTCVAADMRETKDFLKQNKIPVLLMFSDNDPITKGQDIIFQQLCQEAVNWPVKGGGHFLQEDLGESLSGNIISWMTNP